MKDSELDYSARDVAMAVRRLDLMMAQMHLEMSERLGMSAAELLALAYLSVDGPLGPTELTHRLHITTGAMTAMLDRLAERDYVVREPHATDRRRIMVSLTKSGRDRIFTQVHGMATRSWRCQGSSTPTSAWSSDASSTSFRVWSRRRRADRALRARYGCRPS